jgi:hypothetical protein
MLPPIKLFHHLPFKRLTVPYTCPHFVRPFPCQSDNLYQDETVEPHSCTRLTRYALTRPWSIPIPTNRLITCP